MEQAEYPRFGKLVAELFARYPNTAMGELTISSWWKDLARYERTAVEYAFANAGKGKEQADFIPSCEVVRQLAEVEQKRIEVIRKRQARGYLPPPKPQERPSLRPDAPFAQLAAMWEQALEHWGKFPDARPDDWHEKQKKQFADTWELVFGEKWGAW